MGTPRGENVTGYNIRQSFELGYRYHTVGGNEGTYLSMVNYGNGVRLLSSSLSIQSLEGHGRWFDHIQLDTQGLGNDPYQNAFLRIEKNRLYRYELGWRSNAYYNPGLSNFLSIQYADTVRNYQDQDFTLFPQGNLKFFLGYSRNAQTGPALTSTNLFQGSLGDIYPLFANVRRQQNEVRAGFEANYSGWRLNAMHGWVDFKDDTPVDLNAPSAGLNTSDLNTLNALVKRQPYHGTSPYWRVVLFKNTRWLALNGRFTYVNGQRDFITDETAAGTGRLGQLASMVTFVSGSGQRPAAAGDFNVSVFPTANLTITNQTAVSSIRMSGSAVVAQSFNGGPIVPFVPFDYLGISMVSNSTDADYRPTKWLGVRLGYQYSNRQIRSLEAVNPSGPQPEAEQDNTMNTGRLGLRLRPHKSLTINLEGEIARADRPFYPISTRNVQAFRGRAEYKRGKFRAAGYVRTDYNLNSVSLSSFASHSRQYGADGTWTFSRAMFIDVGYAKLHLDTLGTLNYFAQYQSPVNVLVSDKSYYVSNIHNANVASHFALGSRVDLNLGLSYIQDTGDGRSTPFGTSPYGKLPDFQVAQTFPLRFVSPQGKVSVSINERIRWNVGYQRYVYSQEFSTSLNFRAHTGYTSVLWSF